MRDLAVLLLHLLVTVARLVGPGGARAVVAESVLVKQQVLILNRARKRAPSLRPTDRVVTGLCALLIRPGRLIRSAVVIRSSTLLQFHRALPQRKYRRLFSSAVSKKPGPQGPTQDVIAAVVDMKQRNPTWGSPRITQQMTLAFGLAIGKDVVRRILAVRYQPTPDSMGPSWLTVLGHAKDSLWSLDLFRCESATLRSHWVLVVMDHYTRRIVGFGVQAGAVDGPALAPTMIRSTATIHGAQISASVTSTKSRRSRVPRSHPFVERLIGTMRRECLDRSLFGTAADLETKLGEFQRYYDEHRTHAGRAGRPPAPRMDAHHAPASLKSYRWEPHCHGLYHTPLAA